MCLTSWFNEYLNGSIPGTDKRWQTEYVLRLCTKLSGVEACQRYVIACADAAIQAGACSPANAKALFFALEKTGEEKYREAVCNVMAQLSQMPETADAALPVFCDTLPFRMAYEMKINRMERVGQTAAMFCKKHRQLWDARQGRHAVPLKEEARFLLALTDAIDVCSDQLYEHWRAMVDIYRVTLKGVLTELETAEAETLTAVLYALLSGIGLSLIDPERYLPAARKGIAALRQLGEEDAVNLLEEGFGVK